MSAHVEWLSSRYLDISGEAKPGGFENADGSNEVACLIITSQNDGHGIVIEGRPDNLLDRAREILRAAELLVEKTMRDPELRRLYGLTEPYWHAGTGRQCNTVECQKSYPHPRGWTFEEATVASG